MEAIKDSGRAKSIGVSNFRVRDLEKIYSIPDLKHPPAVNQVRRLSPSFFRLLAHRAPSPDRVPPLHVRGW